MVYTRGYPSFYSAVPKAPPTCRYCAEEFETEDERDRHEAGCCIPEEDQ